MTEEERREQRKRRKAARRRQVRATIAAIFTLAVLVGVLGVYLLAGKSSGLSSLSGNGSDPAAGLSGGKESALESRTTEENSGDGEESSQISSDSTGSGENADAGETVPETESENASGESSGLFGNKKKEKEAERQQLLDDAALTAAGYDYLGAIEQLKTWEGYEEDEEITSLISEYQADNDAMVPVDMEKITHIFYHSLVVDPDRGFTGSGAAGFKQWMTTVYEFDNITQQMYDNGYVLISLYDMVEETTDAEGNVKLTQKQLYLPEGKIPYVLSVDDLSYYHSYDGHGIATKIVLDENGEPTCEYIDADGGTLYGSYDVVPRLNDFLEEHPDGAYHGARGTIALTGYDGIFGYRTDIAYKTHENLDTDQKVWLEAHPDFDYDEE